jgi:hypothetical protein
VALIAHGFYFLDEALQITAMLLYQRLKAGQ